MYELRYIVVNRHDLFFKELLNDLLNKVTSAIIDYDAGCDVTKHPNRLHELTTIGNS